jgi:L-threonylcarbamoyladenylate synthase
MSEIILYPTETIYALGVNPFDRVAWQALCDLKGRSGQQSASWLVRSVVDIERYAEVTPLAYEFMEKYLPGPLTIILKAKPSVPKALQALDGTVSFRISSDKIAQELIENYMSKYNAPLTCTSANVHGELPKQTPSEILLQFKDRAKMITKIIDDGPRAAEASTIVRLVGEYKTILRQGPIVL